MATLKAIVKSKAKNGMYLHPYYSKQTVLIRENIMDGQ